MATNKCLEWTYNSANTNPDTTTNKTANCTALGFGCVNPENNDEKCRCKPDAPGMLSKDNECYCDAGYNQVTGKKADNTTDYSCNACTDNMYNNLTSQNQCATCTGGAIGVPANGNINDTKKGPNTQCVCPENQGYLNDKCVACNGDNQKIAEGKCTCNEGFTQNEDGTCKSGSSSASPLAILIICSLIISIIASIATAAVMIRRKANNARAAEAIVSDAL